MIDDSDSARLRIAMTMAGITQAELADRLGVSQPAIGKTLRMISLKGAGGWTPMVSRAACALVLGLDPEQLRAGGPPLVFPNA